jgi:hypothetical protein
LPGLFSRERPQFRFATPIHSNEQLLNFCKIPKRGSALSKMRVKF